MTNDDQNNKNKVGFVLKNKNKTAIDFLWANNDVIDGNMNKFDEETNKSHNGKTNCRGHSDLLKF